MGVRLLFTLICDDAREEKANKLILIGLYNYSINFQRSPEQKPQPFSRIGDTGKSSRRLGDARISPTEQHTTTGFALPQLYIVRRWFVDSPGNVARTELIEPSGNKRLLGERELPVLEPDKYYQEKFALAGFLLIEGEYTIRTSVGDFLNEEKFVVRSFMAS